MRIRELREAREGVLYHWCREKKAIKAFEENRIVPFWEHKLPRTNEKLIGTSMTRNNHIFEMDIIRLVFDQARLAETNRIVPVDGDIVHYHTGQFNSHLESPSEVSPDTGWKQRRPTRVSNQNHAQYNWAEEFVVGMIRPLNRYLIRIEHTDKLERTRDLNFSVQDYSQRYSVPVQQIERTSTNSSWRAS